MTSTKGARVEEDKQTERSGVSSSIYVAVVVLEAVIIVTLWALGKYFGG